METFCRVCENYDYDSQDCQKKECLYFTDKGKKFKRRKDDDKTARIIELETRVITLDKMVAKREERVKERDTKIAQLEKNNEYLRQKITEAEKVILKMSASDD
ncbi:MAG: hypothetical protein HOD85_11285 [Deltaproteobacteria bacterium]|nr:hypothetical protein [Deltaproteobacteria bacterium]